MYEVQIILNKNKKGIAYGTRDKINIVRNK